MGLHSMSIMKQRAGKTVIGRGPLRLTSTGGSHFVFGPGATLFALADGSVLIQGGEWRRMKNPDSLGVGEVAWDNPPGMAQGVTIGTKLGPLRVNDKGLVTVTQASRLLRKSRVSVYKYIEQGKLRSRRQRGKGAPQIPLSDIKRVLGFHRSAGVWLKD